MVKQINNMKQKLQIVTAIVAILIGLTACQRSTKDQLVGTWHCVKTMTIDGGMVRFEGTETNNDDGTYSGIANAVYTVDTEIEGVNVQVKMGVSFKDSGEWTVNDKEIVSSPTSSGVKVTYMRYYDPSDGSFLMELTGRELLEASDVFVQDLNLMEASTERILMLQENKYVTESIDDDGRKITATYTRVR